MLTIHHVPNTRGFRVIWTCEELGLSYRVEKVDFSARYRASPEWRRMNPVGKVPVMEDDGLVMFESGAMVQYLLDRYGEGRLQPSRGTAEHARYLQWSWFAEATFSRATGEIANHKRAFADAPIEAAMDEMKDRARSCMQALDGALQGKEYLLGDAFTAADIMMGYCLQSFARHVGDSLTGSVSSYWERLCAREAFKRAETANAMS